MIMEITAILVRLKNDEEHHVDLTDMYERGPFFDAEKAKEAAAILLESLGFNTTDIQTLKCFGGD